MLNQLPKPKSTAGGWPWTEETDVKLYNGSSQWPKISIVTPSYNQGKFIEETIRSVLLQNYPNLEYFIIDGGSTDETIDIIRKYEPWITYWVSEKDNGQSDAINKGFKKCNGKIFNWLNSDDYYFNDTFFHIATCFTDNPDVKAVSGKEVQLQFDGTTVVYDGTFISDSLLRTIEFVEIAQPSTFFLADCFKVLGPVAEDLHYLMDGDFWVRYLLWYGQSGFHKIDKLLVNFRFHLYSKTVHSSVTNYFLIERSSILIDLQKFIGLPEMVINYWQSDVLGTPEIYALNRSWKFNKAVISKRNMKIYYLKKYVLSQLQRRNRKKAFFGITQLIKNTSFDLFTAKCLLKLIVIKTS